VNKTVLTCVALLIFLPMLIGCGRRGNVHEPNRTAITGTVVLDGKPLPAGCVTFVSSDDRMRRVTTVLHPDGTFSVADAPVGHVRVAVDTEGCRVGNPDAYVPVPVHYRNCGTSGLSFDIAQGDGSEAQRLAVDLKSKSTK
jgi:hypothetical protein